MTIAYLPGRASSCRPPGAGRFSTTTGSRGRGSSQRTTVTVAGEVDAANAKEFAMAVCAALPSTGSVVLDLTALDFIAVDGIAALHAINAHQARAGIAWHVEPSRAVLRVLALCDPEGLIPRPSSHDARLHAIA